MAEQKPAAGSRWIPVGAFTLLVLCAGCGGSGASTAAPAATAAASAPGDASIARPADATQALMDAVRRTADFKDVEWEDDTMAVQPGVPDTDYRNAFTATRNPARIQNKTRPGPGEHALTTIEDLASNALCTTPEGAPTQRFAGTGASVETVDPFHVLKVNGSGWTFAPDVVVNGHNDWQLTGSLLLGRESGQYTPTSSTVDVFVDPRNGRIEKTVAHATLTQAGHPDLKRTITDTNFVYDTGATVPAC